MYGAVNDRTSRGAVVLAAVAVALLAAIVGGVMYMQARSARERDEADLPALAAEHDRLAAATASLRALMAAADPGTAPELYARLTADARAAVDGYRSVPRAAKLPSGRAWPDQFVQADAELDAAMTYLNLVNTYLGQRKAVKGNRPEDRADVDQNIRNVAGTGSEHVRVLDDILGDMKRQRDRREWQYASGRRAG